VYKDQLKQCFSYTFLVVLPVEALTCPKVAQAILEGCQNS